MKIEQAFFGNNDGSHDVLFSTIEDSKLIGKLKPMTDKPSSIDVEYAYLSAYKINNYYVFCKTVKDKTARRGGMVFSHCLIISLDDIANLHDLSILFSYFYITPLKDYNSITQIEIVENKQTETPKAAIYDTTLNYLLTKKRTVIFLGYEDFELVVINLWATFPVPIRNCFTFTISGTPDEIKDENYTLVHTPEASLNRWHSYDVIKAVENVTPNELHTFFSNTEKDTTFANFITENEITISTIFKIQEIYKCFELVEKAKSENNFDEFIRIIHKISDILSDKNKGAVLKKWIFRNFIEHLKNVNFEEFLKIRNLKFECFNNVDAVFKTTAQQWITNNINASSKNEFSAINKLLSKAYQGEIYWWNEMVINQIQMICANTENENVQFIWNLLLQNFELIDNFEKAIKFEDERVFVGLFPAKTNEVFLKKASSFSLSKKWFSLFATSNLLQFELKEVMNLQLKKDNSANLLENLLIIAKNKEKAFVLEAVKFDDKNVHKVSGQLCAEDLSIFKQLDITQKNWQIIWLESYQFTKDINKGIVDIKTKFFTLLDLKIDNKEVVQALFDKIIEQESNLFDYPQRKKVWNTLSHSEKEICLNSTALHIFNNFNEITFSEIENELMNCLKSANFINSQVLSSRKNTKYKTQFIEKIGLLDENVLIDVLKKSNTIDYIDAEYIGNIIKNRGWKRALNHIYDNSSKHSNFKSILEYCKDMLNFIQKLFLLNGEKLNSAEDIVRYIKQDNLPKVFEILNEANLKDNTYEKLKKEYIGDFSKGKDKQDFTDRLIVYVRDIFR